MFETKGYKFPCIMGGNRPFAKPDEGLAVDFHPKGPHH
jgi:hypothetical protein